ITGAAALTRQVLAEKPANQPVKEKQAAADKPADKPVKEKSEPAVQSAKEKAEEKIQAPAAQVSSCQAVLVKAVDVENSTITFDDKAPAAVAGRTFRVARDAHITIDSKPGKLADLPPGAFVSLTFSVDQKTVQLHASGPSNVCDCGGSLVKAVDV